MNNQILTLNSVSVSLDGENILRDVSFFLQENDWLMIVGPNGAGKSTLVKAIGRNVEYGGTIVLGDRDIKEIVPKEFARHVGFLSQNNYCTFDFSVREIVEMGRYCWDEKSEKAANFSNCDKQNAANSSTRRDRLPVKVSHASTRHDRLPDKASHALQITGIEKLADTPVTKISGGELQRTFLAQVLAQDPDILILDEPTNHLDLKYQDGLLSIVDKWKNKPGRAVISVMHDITLAKKFGTHALLLGEGSVIAQGTTDKTFTKQNLQSAFGADVEGYMRQILEVWK